MQTLDMARIAAAQVAECCDGGSTLHGFSISLNRRSCDLLFGSMLIVLR
jgi:hypothetical protein